MKKSQKKQLLNLAFVLFLLVLTLVVLYYSSGELNLESLQLFFDDCNIWWIVAAVGCMLLYALLEALTIKFILRKFGYKPHFRSTLAYASSDIYYSAVTPSATGGQPASVFYMLRDGVPSGTAAFALVFNLVGYTAALLILGTLCLIFNFSMFLNFSVWVKLFIIVGFVAQLGLLLLSIACFRRPKIVLKIGNWAISLLVRIRIIKKEQKWRDRITRVVDKYHGCFESFKSQHGLFVRVLAFNIVQRAALIMVSVFVCMSATSYSMLELFAMQTFAMIGYNSIPLPGGSGAYEFLYINIYGAAFTEEFTIIALMVTRVISYYLSMLVTGGYTLVYHMVPVPGEKHDGPTPPSAPEAETQPCTPLTEETTSNEKDGTKNEEV